MGKAVTFEGKPCKHGHGTTRYVSNKACAECARQASLRCHHANPEKSKIKAQKWDKINPGKRSLLRRQWRKNNPEKVRVTAQKWRDKNREIIAPKMAENSKKWAENNREKVRSNHRRWSVENRNYINTKARDAHQKNPERARPHKSNRRAREIASEGRIYSKDIELLNRVQGRRCAYCPETENLHLDHVIPLSRGGSNWPWNLQWLCAHHNLSKSNRTDVEYRRLIGLPERLHPSGQFYATVLGFAV